MTLPLRTRRGHLTAQVAALLLLSQGLAAGGLGLVHASERITAPSAIEAEHGKACVVLHDPARCPGCQAVGVAALPEPCRTRLEPDGRAGRWVAPRLELRAARLFSRATASRAPPTFSV